MTTNDITGEIETLRSILVDLSLAFINAREYLFSSIASSTFEKKGERCGDGTTIHDPIVFDRFYLEVARKHGMHLICEEQTRRSKILDTRTYNYLLILDPIDGTKNMIAGLPFGVNAAFGALPFGRDFTLGDLQGVFVGDYLTKKQFTWIVGSSPTIHRPEYVPSQEWAKFNGESNIFEVPDEHSYLPPSYPEGERHQRNLLAVFRTLFPDSQRRSLDCTGLRLLEVADGNLMAYGDVRRATRIWDTIPSIKFILEQSPAVACLLGDLSEYGSTTKILEWQKNATFKLVEHIGDEVIVLPRHLLPEMMAILTAKKVFIVHGRDISAAEEVARFLETQAGCECTLLKEKLNRSQTIIQKLNRYSDVQAAVVILSPDDEGRLAQSGDQLQPRARQNVIFELGLFYGKLGQENVIAMSRGVEKPSDIDGVLHIEFDSQGAWKHELLKEMQEIIAQQSAAPYALSAPR